jgi:hypothetical protein
MKKNNELCSGIEHCTQSNTEAMTSLGDDTRQHFLTPILQEDRRLMTLFFLMKVGGYQTNDHVLYDALELIGHCVSWDILHSELAWLDQQGIVRLRDADSDIKVIELTRSGMDVAKGRKLIDGVRRPHPEEVESWKFDQLA